MIVFLTYLLDVCVDCQVLSQPARIEMEEEMATKCRCHLAKKSCKIRVSPHARAAWMNTWISCRRNSANFNFYHRPKSAHRKNKFVRKLVTWCFARAKHCTSTWWRGANRSCLATPKRLLLIQRVTCFSNSSQAWKVNAIPVIISPKMIIRKASPLHKAIEISRKMTRLHTTRTKAKKCSEAQRVQRSKSVKSSSFSSNTTSKKSMLTIRVALVWSRITAWTDNWNMRI